MNCMQRSVYFRYSDVLKRTIAINYGVQPKALLKWMSGRLHEVGWLIFNAIKLSVMHLTSTSFRLYRICCMI
ncbi:hypothetical protein CIPAW_05G027700 [Carya illinoinensis]|uniref:Uncharacterized protein n=1 Tax=Carya illinoinensis TaxID=32201 RepID=A0A8T1QED8_CARIL|nr:hypothetical protein CIPAW_05G027700 [Carya illinoinensis]